MELGRLGTLWPIATDARGTLFTTASVRMSDGLAAVYKQYHEHFLTVGTVRHAEALVRRLGGADAALDARVARPLALIANGRLVTGFLMRETPAGLVPPEELEAWTAPDGPAGLRAALTAVLDALHAAGVTLGERPGDRLLIDPGGDCFLNAGDELLAHEPADDGEPDALQRIATANDVAFVEELLNRLAGVPVVAEAVAAEPEPVVVAAEPVPAEPEPSELAPRVRVPRWLLMVVALLTALLAVGVGVRLLGGPREVRAARSSAAKSGPSAAPSPESYSAAVTVGAVDVSAVAGDPDTLAVAAVFDTYFAAINAHDADRAVSVFDPARGIDAKSFGHGVSTSHDTDVRLLGIAVGPPVTARVTLRSEQAPGLGPRARPDETCTRWDITYELGHPAAAVFLIERAMQATSAPC
jgi:hypothetical protein